MFALAALSVTMITLVCFPDNTPLPLVTLLALLCINRSLFQSVFELLNVKFVASSCHDVHALSV